MTMTIGLGGRDQKPGAGIEEDLNVRDVPPSSTSESVDNTATSEVHNGSEPLASEKSGASSEEARWAV